MRTLLRRAAATAAATAGIAAGGAVAPAEATVQYTVDNVFVCISTTCNVRVVGTITWHNRTATITGDVINGVGGSATATFTAYAGSFVAETTRTASGVSTKPFSFVIGDPNLVGGINRIVVRMSLKPPPGGLVVPGSEVEYKRD